MGIWFEIIVIISLLFMVLILLAIAVDLRHLANYVRFKITDDQMRNNINVVKQHLNPRR